MARRSNRFRKLDQATKGVLPVGVRRSKSLGDVLAEPPSPDSIRTNRPRPNREGRWKQPLTVEQPLP